MPVSRVTRYLKVGKYAQRVGADAPIYPPSSSNAIAGSGRGKSKPAASRKSMSRSSTGLQFPVGRVTRYLKVGNYAHHVSTGAPVHLVIEVHIPPAPPLLLASNAAHDNKKNQIMPRHIQPTVCNDEELSRLLCAFTIVDNGLMPGIHTVLLPKKAGKAKDDIHRQAS
ncbi:probable histone H2AXb [Triticum dicoccoides]|uniref:probable histone H2AXb n=1 Tax=Triticum dicoccoides TaxID=85692 RepID=UPI001891268E|nr:probable histone H2AXb [Triticum dicoccoides]